MAKRPSITQVLSGFLSAAKLNQNFTNIQSAFDNTLSRDGSTPNHMLTNLDMNGQRVINLPEPLSPNDAARLQDIQDVIDGGVTLLIDDSITPGVTTKAPSQNAVAEAIDDVMDVVDTKVDADYVDSVLGSYVAPVTSVSGKTGSVFLNKSDVGLGAVDNTSDANKPLSTAAVTALNGKLNASNGLFSRNSGDEGGQFYLELPTSGSTLSANVAFDVKGNRVRIFEDGGTSRGVYIDLTEVSGGAASKLATLADVDDITKYAIPVDGTTASSSALSSAFALTKRLVINRGTLLISGTDLTINSGLGYELILQGDAKLKIATGRTFAFYGNFVVSNPNRFGVIEEVGTGQFVGPTKIRWMWWHMTTAADSIHVAWNKALRCARGQEAVTAATTSDMGQININTPPGTFRTSEPLVVTPNKNFSPFFSFGDGVLDRTYLLATSSFTATAYTTFSVDGVVVRPVIHIAGTPPGEQFEICKYGFGPGLVVGPEGGGGTANWGLLIGSPETGTNSLGATVTKFINAETPNTVHFRSFGLNHVCQVNAIRVIHDGDCNSGTEVLKAKAYSFRVTNGAYCGDSYIAAGVNARLPVPGNTGYSGSAYLYCQADAGNFDNTTGAGKNFITYIEMRDSISHGGEVGVKLIADRGSNVDEIKGKFTHDQGNRHYLYGVAYKRNEVGANAVSQINNVNLDPMFMTGMTNEAVYLACLDNSGLTRSRADIEAAPSGLVGRIDKVEINPVKVIRPGGPLAFFSNGVRNFRWDGCTLENAQYVGGPMVNIEGGSGIKFTNFTLDLDGYTDPFALSYFLRSRDAEFTTIEADFKDYPVTYYIRDLSQEAADGSSLTLATTPTWIDRHHRDDIKRLSDDPLPTYVASTNLDIPFWDRNKWIRLTGNATVASCILMSGQTLGIMFDGVGTVQDGNTEGADPTGGIMLPGGNLSYKKFTTLSLIGYNGVAMAASMPSVN